MLQSVKILSVFQQQKFSSAEETDGPLESPQEEEMLMNLLDHLDGPMKSSETTLRY